MALPPSITPAPIPGPQRNDRATFSDRVDAFVTWVSDAPDEFGAVAAYVNQEREATDAKAQAAAASAGAALASKNAAEAAQSVVQAHAQTASTKAGEAATSASNAAGSATAAATAKGVAEAKALEAKGWADAAAAAAGDMPGIGGHAGKYLKVNAGATGMEWSALAFATQSQAEGGTANDVLMTPLRSAQAIAALAKPSLYRSARTSNTQLVAADKGKLIDITSGTFTQTFAAAAALGDGWFCYIKNGGTGNVTLGPNASEAIDGLAALVMYPGFSRLVQCDGSALRTVLLAGEQIFIARDERPSGTASELPSDVYGKKTINTIQFNSIDGASISNSLITLAAGTYSIDAIATAKPMSNYKVRIFNNTDSAPLIVGQTTFGGGANYASTESFVRGVVTLISQKTISLEHRAGGAVAAAPASSFGDIEVYAQMTIRKLA